MYSSNGLNSIIGYLKKSVFKIIFVVVQFRQEYLKNHLRHGDELCTEIGIRDLACKSFLLRASTPSTVTYAPGTLQSLQSLLVAMLEGKSQRPLQRRYSLKPSLSGPNLFVNNNKK